MRKLLLFLVIVFLFILGAGVSTLPEVFRPLAPGATIPDLDNIRLPPGLYLLTLANLVLFIGVLLAIVVHHFLRTMIGLFILCRIAEIVWEYALDMHSLWYLIISVTVYLVIGGGAIYLLTRAENNKTSVE